MCMKYLNAITTPYARIVLDDDVRTILALQAPLHTLYCSLDDKGRARVQAFDVLTELSFLGTSKEENKAINPVSKKAVFDVTLRLTRCDADPQKRVFVDLDHFVADLSQPDNDSGHKYACFDYAIRTRITRLKDQMVILPPGEDCKPAYGAYVLKVIVQEQGVESSLTVQGIASLKIIPRPSNSDFTESINGIGQPELSAGEPEGELMPMPFLDCN